MIIHKTSSAILAASALLTLAAGGCAKQGLGMYEPSEVNARRLEIQESRFEQVLPVSAADPTYLSEVAETYLRYGNSDLAVTVLYDPAARLNGPRTASREAVRLADSLKEQGVSGAQASTLPVAGQGETLRALFSYDQIEATPPTGCGTMPGLDNSRADYRGLYETNPYRLGCGVETMISRQVERPADLTGRAGLKGPSDGRRQSLITESYRTGKPNEPLEDTESASGTK